MTDVIGFTSGGTFGSLDAPIMTIFPLTARPSRILLIAFSLGTVASMTLAHPNLLNCSRASIFLVKRYACYNNNSNHNNDYCFQMKWNMQSGVVPYSSESLFIGL